MAYTPPRMPFAIHDRVRHPEFGLGTVETCTQWNVEVRFDTSKIIMFSTRGGPIQGVIWQAGQPVLVRGRALVGVVTASKARDGVLHYKVQMPATGKILIVPAAGLSDPPASERADERLAQGQWEEPKLFYLRTMGHYLASARGQLGSNNIAARIVPKYHQLSVAHRVVNAPRQRFLLADEVGLGKTIETGLILQELRARGSLLRTLIVVPPNLATQWLYELHYKFNERFKLYDASRVREEKLSHPDQNIWEIGQNIICSQSFITSHPEEWGDILKVAWDMVIFDEAHHVRRQLESGNRRIVTQLYRFASQISERTRGLLLLTATPMQLDPFELFSLLELLDPALFPSYEFFEAQRDQNKALNLVMKDLLDADRPGPDRRREIVRQVQLLLTDSTVEVEDIWSSLLARDRVIEQLATRHLLSEAMIRNRKRAVGGFTKRIPHIIPVELSEAERTLYTAVITFVRIAYRRLDSKRQAFTGFVLVGYQKRLTSSIYAFKASATRRLEKLVAQQVMGRVAPPDGFEEADLDEIMTEYGDELAIGDAVDAAEIEITALRALLRQAETIQEDAKFLALERYLTALFAADPEERILIFTQFTDTLTYLESRLQERWPVAVFHGGMPHKAKDSAIARVQLGDARILVSTEAGGEGRNLQFCAVLINYDLPWNPMKIEQRIGRLDRIGQERDVRIYNFSIRGTVEERVLDVLNQRIHAFEETIGGLDPILGQMELDLQKIVLESRENKINGDLAAYADRIEAEVARARQADEVLRDFVMDWRSYDQRVRENFDPMAQERLVRHANKWSKSLLKTIGASIRPLSYDTYSVRLGKDMRVDLPRLTRDTYQVTFNYHQALTDSLVEYGSFGHPLFDALLDYVTKPEFGRGLATRRTIVDAEHAGFRGFQFNFVVTLKSVHTIQRVVPLVVDCAGVGLPQLVDLLLDTFDWRSTPEPFETSFYDDWPGLVSRVYDAAESILEEQLQREVADLQARRIDAYAAESRKIEQYCTYRETQGAQKLEHDSNILARFHGSDRDEDRRVIPIWERNVENDRAYLKTLAQERARLVSELAGQRHVTFSYSLLNAAWVMVVPPAGEDQAAPPDAATGPIALAPPEWPS